ncbi:hypothetical protein G7077_02415 [Sphingomonas piscis]|uniref:Uncharacterized protein n=1 Tax=Sphingomonas piscis TaxID=2714943 RepID=A0A6G7YMH9_9SPHN|nr:hypothetical protein [Sphingomonas piscis]QIK77937.1 hypothetical protein G7077_02415 [Sphingomonas piscis]
MTPEEVRLRVAAIDEIADLVEQAHMREDRLYFDVMAAIASGAENPAELARAALATRQLSLDRYYSPPTD